MLFLIRTQQNKPDRITTAEIDKDSQYHVNYARWVIGDGLSIKQHEYLENYNRNKAFYKNNQWLNPEDKEAFFIDEGGHDRHRIKVTKNYIQPMVEQYRGNAERMTFDVKAQSISPLAKSRRDSMLNKLLNYRDAAEQNPEFGTYLKKEGFPIEDTEEATISKFDNMYVDNYIIAINRLIRYVKEVNDLDKYKKILAGDIALAGIGIMKPFHYAGEWRYSRVLPDRFGWDRGATEQNLSDSEYFYEFTYDMASNIYERHQAIQSYEREAIETYVSQVVNRTAGLAYDVGYRVPIYKAVWRDIVSDTYGYVEDDLKQRILARINYISESEDVPKYTMKDVISIDKLTKYQKRVLRGTSTHKLYVDLWRYCEFIPNEILSISINSRTHGTSLRDIVLDYGIIPYQEPNLYSPTNMAPPYKVGTWSYMDGEVLSPVDVVINPQRMINRFLSVMEQQINISGGSAPVYDKDLIGTSEDEDNIEIKMKRGEPIGVYAKGKGVQNAVGKYDSGIKEGTLVFANLIDNFKSGIEEITGVNEGLKGQTSGPDQLVGVMQLMIQRGSILQEPFYAAIMEIFKGCYQSAISSGKRFYIDNETELVDIVGIESAEVIKLSKDMRGESFRATLKRSIDPDTERVYVDQQLIQWIQYGLIDQGTAAMLYGRANQDEAIMEMRGFQKRFAEQKRKAAQEQSRVTAQQTNIQDQTGQVMYSEKLRDETRESLEKDKANATKLGVAQINASAKKDTKK